MTVPALHPVTVSDVDDLIKIGRQTFLETFADGNHPNDMDDYLATAFCAETLVPEIENPGSRFFILRETNTPIGYLKLNHGDAQTETVQGNLVEIERIYLAATHQGKGLGSLLFNTAMREAKAGGFEGIWLGVWEKNTSALAFYERQGFKQFGSHDFVIGDDVQTDYMMRLDFSAYG